MPDTIQFKGGHQILNTYDAGGRKLRTDYITKHTPILLPIDKDTVCHWDYASGLIGMNTTLYVDNKEYEIIRSPVQYTKLNRVHNPEGYVSNFGAYPPAEHYCYYRKDHLGNNREVWRAAYTSGTTGNQIAATTIQRTQYYPSGLPWASSTSDNPGSQPYKYNGKEIVEMHGWDSYDYGARVMYPAIGPQFMNMDPLAEDYYDVSPYAYGLNNPIRYNDPTGMRANDTITVNKNIPEVTVTTNRFSPVGTRALDPISGFWGWVGYYTFGRTYESGNHNNGNLPVVRATWNVNADGVITGVVPLTGTPPIPTFKGGSLFIKGFKYVDKLDFHKIIKPKILKEARKVQEYSRIVGSNPDIVIENSKIVLQGAKNSPFAGKVLKTELSVIDFFK